MYFSRNRMIFSWKWDLLCYNKLVCHFLFHTYIRHTGLVSCRCMRFIPERRTLDGTFNHSKRLSFRIKSARYTDCNQNSKRFFPEPACTSSESVPRFGSTFCWSVIRSQWQLKRYWTSGYFRYQRAERERGRGCTVSRKMETLRIKEIRFRLRWRPVYRYECDPQRWRHG